VHVELSQLERIGEPVGMSLGRQRSHDLLAPP